jgi:hypothetical protein
MNMQLFKRIVILQSWEKLFSYQQMHFISVLENTKIYIKTYINAIYNLDDIKMHGVTITVL